MSDASTLGLPVKSAAYFRDLAEDAGNWSGNPWLNGNVAGGRGASAMSQTLVRHGLIEVGDDGSDAFAIFTHQGVAAAARIGVDLSWIERPAGEPVEEAPVEAPAPAPSKPTARERLVEAAKLAGWVVDPSYPESFRAERGRAWVFAQFSASGGITHASLGSYDAQGINAGGEGLYGRDRLGQLRAAILTELAPTTVQDAIEEAGETVDPGPAQSSPVPDVKSSDPILSASALPVGAVVYREGDRREDGRRLLGLVELGAGEVELRLDPRTGDAGSTLVTAASSRWHLIPGSKYRPVTSTLGYQPASHCSECQGGGEVKYGGGPYAAPCWACGGSGRRQDQEERAAELQPYGDPDAAVRQSGESDEELLLRLVTEGLDATRGSAAPVEREVTLADYLDDRGEYALPAERSSLVRVDPAELARLAAAEEAPAQDPEVPALANHVRALQADVRRLTAERDEAAARVLAVGELLAEAHEAAHRASSANRPGRDQAVATGRYRGLRDGLLAAYAVLVGQEEEAVHEGLQDDLIAKHEVAQAQRG